MFQLKIPQIFLCILLFSITRTFTIKVERISYRKIEQVLKTHNGFPNIKYKQFFLMKT